MKWRRGGKGNGEVKGKMERDITGMYDLYLVSCHSFFGNHNTGNSKEDAVDTI